MIVLSTLMTGYTLSYLWEWLISPTFDVKVLTVRECMGLSLILGFLFYQQPKDKKEDKKEFIEELMKVFFVRLFICLFSLLIAYIIISV